MANGGWQFDKHIPIAVIFALLLQTMGVVWWAANISARVDALENWVQDNRRIEARLTSIETELRNLVERLDRRDRTPGDR